MIYDKFSFKMHLKIVKSILSRITNFKTRDTKILAKKKHPFFFFFGLMTFCLCFIREPEKKDQAEVRVVQCLR